MAMMYPNVNQVMSEMPESASLLRTLRAPRHEPLVDHSQDNDDAEKIDGSDEAQALDYSSVFPMSFGHDLFHDDETDPFGDHGQHARDSSAHYSHTSVSREASNSSVEPLVMSSTDLPPPYSPPSAGLAPRAVFPSMLQRNAQASRYTHIAGETTSDKKRAQKGRAMSFSTPSTLSSSATTPPLVLELFIGHRLASKVARRRALKRTQQLSSVHEKWQALGVDTRAIVASASSSSTEPFFDAGSKTLSGKAAQSTPVAIDEVALSQVKAAKSMLPPAFWQPPNYGPQEMDRQLRALGL